MVVTLRVVIRCVRRGGRQSVLTEDVQHREYVGAAFKAVREERGERGVCVRDFAHNSHRPPCRAASSDALEGDTGARDRETR